MTYGEASTSRTAVESGLIYHGVLKGARIGLYFINRPEWIIVDHACAGKIPCFDRSRCFFLPPPPPQASSMAAVLTGQGERRPIPIDRADDPPGDAAPPQGVGGKIYATKLAHSDRRHSL